MQNGQLYRQYLKDTSPRLMSFQLINETRFSKKHTQVHKGDTWGRRRHSQEYVISSTGLAITRMFANGARRVRIVQPQKHSNRAPLQDRQKAHGKAYAQDDLVWVHSKVIPQCVSGKLHRPWTGPYRILKQLSDSVYRLQNPRQRPIIHFDRLKPCPPTI